MTLVNIDPHVILHQKTHVPRAVNFLKVKRPPSTQCQISECPMGISRRKTPLVGSRG